MVGYVYNLNGKLAGIIILKRMHYSCLCNERGDMFMANASIGE